MNKINQNLKKLFSQGYCVVDNVLEDVECKKFITHLKNINQNLSKNKFYVDERSNKGQVIIRDLIFRKPDIFLKVIDNIFVMKFLKKIFNDVFILDNVMASNSINVKKNYKSLVHMDAHLPCKQNKNTADVIAFFCLEPFYKQNGSTRIWPKSHKTGIRIQNSKNYKHLIKRRSVVLEAKRGSCVFILGQTWHQIGKNEDSNSRWGIFTHYKRWWIKPSTDFTKCGLKIFNKLNNKQKELLGFNSISPRYDFKKQTKKIRTLRKISQIKNLSYKKTLDY
jgi:ectoine hydroxylase-related dioxygenase (phytanoyl-CoA dioxygenase family)